MSASTSPAAPRTRHLRIGLLAAISSCCLVIAGAALALVGSRASTGNLLVTLSAPEGASELAIVVDGRVRCNKAPCLVEGLEQGSHFVRVVGKGFEPTAELGTTVSAKAQSTFNVELLALAPVAKAHPRVTAVAHDEPARVTQLPAPITDDDATLAAHKLASVTPRTATRQAMAKPAGMALSNTATAPQTPAVTPPATTPPAVEAGNRAVLRINSTPSVPVTVDGRPVGKTPRLVRVAPGTHRVAFIGSEGRTSRTVTVGAGSTTDVAVSF